jgi:transposase
MTISTERMKQLYLELYKGKTALQIKKEHPNWSIDTIYYHVRRYRKDGYRPFNIIKESVIE